MGNRATRLYAGIKATSKENPVMRFLRTCYYKLIKRMSSVEQIEHFTGFGLYDRSFIQVLHDLGTRRRSYGELSQNSDTAVRISPRAAEEGCGKDS